MTLIIYAALSIAALILILSWRGIKIHALRQRNIYPKKGHATLQDIERLIETGRKDLAILCHRELYKSSLADAKQSIDNIQKSSTPHTPPEDPLKRA